MSSRTCPICLRAYELACDIANWWWRTRRNIAAELSADTIRKLDELEAETRGNPLRCVCGAVKHNALGGSVMFHDMQCPARWPETR